MIEDKEQITREELVNRIFRSVADRRYFSLMGPRGRGTSTILRRLYRKVNRRPESDHYLPVFIDFATLEPAEEKVHLVNILNTIARASGFGEGFTGEITADQFSTHLTEIIRFCPIQLILLIDHIDALPDDVARALLVGLRSLYRSKLGVVVAGARNLMHLTIGELSPFNVAETHLLKPLPFDESLKLIDEIARENELFFSQFEAEAIFHLVCGEPSLIKRLIRTQASLEHHRFGESYLSPNFTHSFPYLVDTWHKDQLLRNVIQEIESNYDWLKLVADLCADDCLPAYFGGRNEDALQSPDMCLALERCNSGYVFASPFFAILLKAHFTPLRLADVMVINHRWREAKEWYERAGQQRGKFNISPDVYTMEELILNAFQSVERTLDNVEDAQSAIVEIAYYVLGVNSVALFRENREDEWALVERRSISNRTDFLWKTGSEAIENAGYQGRQMTVGNGKLILTPSPLRRDLQWFLCTQSEWQQSRIQRKAQETLMRYYANVVLELQKTDDVERLVEDQRNQLELVSEINTTILESSDATSTAQTILKALDQIGYPDTTISQLTPDKRRIKGVAARGSLQPLAKHVNHAMDSGDILARIVGSGKPEYIEEPKKDGRVAQDLLQMTGVGPRYFVPLKTSHAFGWPETGVFSVLQIANIPEPGRESRTLNRFTQLASIALANARLHEETRLMAKQLDDRLNALVNVSMTLGEPKRPDEILTEMLAIARESLNAHWGYIVLYDPDFESLAFQAISGREWAARNLKEGHRIDESSTAGYVAKLGKPVLNPDVKAPGVSYFQAFKDIQSNCGVPIFINGQSAGSLILESKEKNAFNADDLRLLETFAHIISIAIAQSRDFLMANTFSEISKVLSETEPLRDRLQKVCQITRDALSAGHCSILVIPEAGIDRIMLEATTSERLRHQIGEAEYTLGEGFTGWIAEKKRPLRPRGKFTSTHLASIGAGLKWEQKYMEEDLEGNPDFDFLGVPLLMTSETCIGVIRCTAKKDPLQLFNYDDQELLMSVGRQVAQAIQRDRLEEARTRWLAEAVHQLSGPLHTVKSDVDDLLEISMDVAEQTAILKDIQEDVERVIRLTDRIALSDKLKSGNISPEFQSVLLRDFIRQIWKQYRAEANSSSVSLCCNCPEDLIAEVDAQLLGEALGNLFSNALKFTPNGTAIIVRARRIENSVEIKVRDQGPGLTPEAEKRYFELYFSTPPPTGKSTGQGLGLYIAQQIVHLHNGRLQASNKGGRRTGAVFTITLPARRN